MIFIERAFADLRHKAFPDPGLLARAERMAFRIPAVERPHDGNLLGIGCPDGEKHAPAAVLVDQMRTELPMQVEMRSFVKQIQVVSRQQGHIIGHGVRLRFFFCFGYGCLSHESSLRVVYSSCRHAGIGEIIFACCAIVRWGLSCFYLDSVYDTIGDPHRDTMGHAPYFGLGSRSMKWTGSRREFLKASSAIAGAGLAYPWASGWSAEPTGKPAGGVEVLHPRMRVPLSFIIDDSTCLVNMGHFCTPQFQSCYPDRAEYNKDWRKWPREIPDAFVREFGEWCGEQGVKGKYSIVPYPACVGWLDRELPGWPRKELAEQPQAGAGSDAAELGHSSRK